MTASSIDVVHAFVGRSVRAREALAGALPERRLVAWTEDDEFARGIGEVEAIVVLRPPRGHWSGARCLRLVQTVGAGVDSILPADDLAQNVILANASGIHAGPMSEFALGMMLALAKGFSRSFDQQHEAVWRRYVPQSLGGQTLGILGLGSIGRELARRAHFLGMRVIGTRRRPTPVPCVEEVVAPEETLSVLRRSDYVVVVLPLTPETRGLIDSSALEEMKPGSFLINIARGGIVNEQALCRALESGRLAGAGIDVFEQEPLPASSPLWSAPRILLTPHIAGGMPGYMDRVAEIFAENIRRVERGEPVMNRVDRERGY